MVKPKKHLGQHFLKDLNIARKIADSIAGDTDYILEVGPGTGVLSRFLKERFGDKLFVAEVDQESVDYLQAHDIIAANHILGDFLKLDLQTLFPGSITVIGNFPYNISSQIVFKAIDNRAQVLEFAGMFQKEVAERIGAAHGNKQYGILSVMAQAYFEVDYLFSVSEKVFVPPPKVQSAVIRMKRKEQLHLDCDEVLFKNIVKTSFNTRRKMLRKSLKSLVNKPEILSREIFTKRPEQLSVGDFVEITRLLEND